jgi:hypothetical protein
MRSVSIISCSLALLPAPALQAQERADSTGLPGDHFSLAAALDVFKNSKDVASFEKAINDPDQKVNNLDLDGNGEVDYIRVVDHVDKNAHALVLQAPVSKGESQDVAAIELERTGEKSAVVQIRGNEDLYGPDVIVEPYEETEKAAPGQHGPAATELMHGWVVVNVWAWPCVGFIYGPYYDPWISPWYWGYYPPWWHPWHPFAWGVFWGWHTHWHPWYQPVHYCRVEHAHALYVGHRTSSPLVQHRAAEMRRGQTVREPAKARTSPREPRHRVIPAPRRVTPTPRQAPPERRTVPRRPRRH